MWVRVLPEMQWTHSSVWESTGLTNRDSVGSNPTVSTRPFQENVDEGHGGRCWSTEKPKEHLRHTESAEKTIVAQWQSHRRGLRRYFPRSPWFDSRRLSHPYAGDVQGSALDRPCRLAGRLVIMAVLGIRSTRRPPGWRTQWSIRFESWPPPGIRSVRHAHWHYWSRLSKAVISKRPLRLERSCGHMADPLVLYTLVARHERWPVQIRRDAPFWPKERISTINTVAVCQTSNLKTSVRARHGAPPR